MTVTRRDVLRGGATAAAATAVAVTTALAKQSDATPDHIRWIVPDNKFWPAFGEGDVLLLAPDLTPMRDGGIYVMPDAGGLVLVRIVQSITAGEPPNRAPWNFGTFEMWQKHERDFNYEWEKPDTPTAHVILWQHRQHRANGA